MFSEIFACRDRCLLGYGYGRKRRNILDTKEENLEEKNIKKKIKTTLWGCTPWWAQEMIFNFE
jgi:hypothetical protein